MFEDYQAQNSHRNITAALKRLNLSYPSIAHIKFIEERVEFRIINHPTSKALMYKIEEGLPEDVQIAIRETIIDQAKKLRMEVITFNS